MTGLGFIIVGIIVFVIVALENYNDQSRGVTILFGIGLLLLGIVLIGLGIGQREK